MAPVRVRPFLSAFLFLAIALIALPALAVPTDVETLIALLKDKDDSVRLKAAKDLGKLKAKAKDAIPALKAAALKDKDEDVREMARKSLASIVNEIDSAEIVNEKLTPLIAKLKSNDIKQRLSTIKEIGKLGPDAKGAGAALVEFGMMHQSQAVREAASGLLEKVDPEVHKHVVTFLIDDNPQQQASAVAKLLEMGPRARASVPALKARYLFETRGTPEQPGKPNLAIVGALVAIAPNDPAVQTEVIRLVSAPEVDNDRPAILEFMRTVKIDNKQKYTALTKALTIAMMHRPAIIKELGRLGADAKGALPGLMKLKLDPDMAVRDAANAAIEAIME